MLRLLYLPLGLLFCCGGFALESCCIGDDGLTCSTNSLDYQGQVRSRGSPRLVFHNLASPEVLAVYIYVRMVSGATLSSALTDCC